MIVEYKEMWAAWTLVVACIFVIAIACAIISGRFDPKK